MENGQMEIFPPTIGGLSLSRKKLPVIRKTPLKLRQKLHPEPGILDLTLCTSLSTLILTLVGDWGKFPGLI
jgi:hypothetical protein